MDRCVVGLTDTQRGRRVSRQADGEKDREVDIIATVTGAQFTIICIFIYYIPPEKQTFTR